MCVYLLSFMMKTKYHSNSYISRSLPFPLVLILDGILEIVVISVIRSVQGIQFRSKAATYLTFISYLRSSVLAQHVLSYPLK